MYLLDICRRRGQAGAYRPDRLIGHHQIAGIGRVGYRGLKLATADVEGLSLVALLLGFADADDSGQTGAPGRFGLLPNQCITLAMIGAALGMADDDRAGAGIR